MDDPLIYTSKGNLPLASLRYETAWHDTPEYVKFVERHWLGDEVVRESAHVYSKHGVVAQGVAADLA
jgi:hypothetical protein